MRSKKRHDLQREGQRVVGHRKGFGVKEKGNVEEVKRRSTNDEREDAGRQQAVDVDIRHRCALDAICVLNDQLSDIQKEAVRGMVWSTGKRVVFKRSDGDCGVAWDLVHIMEDVDGVGEYNWVEEVWEFLVHTMEESQEKIWSMKNLQINGFVMILQIIPVRDDERRIEAMEALIASEDYSVHVEDAQGVINVEEQLRRVRDALRKEREALAKKREAHTVTKKELAELKEAVVMKTAVDDILEVDDKSQLGSSANANVEPIVRPVAEEDAVEDLEGTAVSGDVTVDYTHNSIDQGGDCGRKSPCDVVVDADVMVSDEKSNEGVAKDGPEVPTRSNKGATYDGPMVVGVDVVRYDTHGTEAETSAGPSNQTSAVVEGTVDEVHDGSGNPSPIATVVMTSDEDSSPTSSEARHRRISPPTTAPTCR
ncbi:hypothetical protein Cgig2_009839 [Carnegiea gigantea]|uniref:Uncharacterized protein n=1 Tax=Carnegiea gigantea TaxID=171969 RepID=A0A9Q1KLN5_9CARY|nr:hypothetical protein Cgig2_009839 [Carnegiea gigantea]